MCLLQQNEYIYINVNEGTQIDGFCASPIFRPDIPAFIRVKTVKFKTYAR